ncbi:hypothetical protein [Enterococcus hirae]|uniref:Uncharacterized protein n=1 Tax=Enterococcus hirae TaxID=1354 RepID=A0AB37ICE4_ENTHR|nr:hypothetical protein [Enterococcus hirae]EMF0441010.1 hypothetical protein [Enterococcus hirae]MCC1499842.1 hypothetical protein [Enterococcus hirae]NBA56466.1 hypothetical protein [Enterococcus hirae]QNG05149.1 hypothetical protein FQ488_05265 [Enterococcus hirae]RBT48288.1 hypothetical protein EB20_01660 [Enterococcus hirae]
MKDTERITVALESIAKSLSTLVEDTKANRELREQNIKMFNQLENKINDLAEDPFGLKQKE